jgi:hypothetical protein
MKDTTQSGHKGNSYVHESQFDLIRVDTDENDNILLVEVIKLVWDQDESNRKIKEEIVRKLKSYEGESFDKFRTAVTPVYGTWKRLD